MKIAVNTRLLLPDKLEGISVFTFETLKRMTHQHSHVEFIFVFDRPPAKEFVFNENVKATYIYPPARHPILFWLWFEVMLPIKLRMIKPDLFLSQDGYISLNSCCKSLPVIHDLNFEHNPQDLPYFYRRYYKHYMPKFAKKATRIATVSEHSKQDLVSLYNIDATKIDVVYNGANTTFKPSSDIEKKATRESFSFGKPYFVFVGSLHPRKNIVNLLKAFDKYKKELPSDVKLLIVGERKWWTAEMEQAYKNMQFKNEVIFTGRLFNKDLNLVLGAAIALTYVSTFEGFGIPILEAFNCDVPVITSNLTSLPEVAADAALYVDPYSVTSIANAMQILATDEETRTTLIERGRIRRKEYSWQKTADLLWQSIEKTINSQQS